MIKRNIIFLLPLGLNSLAYASTTESLNLDDVVVTANKIEQNIKDVPSSVTVITDSDIEDKGIEGIKDLVKQIPNFSTSDFNHQRNVNFRGLNQSLFTSTNPIVIYSDGVPQNSIFDYDVMLENIERVEVLRGPQGTLYGKDTIGGVINVISKAPQNEWSGSTGVEVGSNKYIKGSVSANGALVEDVVFLNLGITSNQYDGWITNRYNQTNANEREDTKVNASITVKPSQELTAKLTIGAKDSNNGYFNGGIGDIKTLKRDDAENARYEIPTYTKTKSLSQALNVDYEFDQLKFSSLTTHKSSDIDGMYDSDFTYNNGNTNLQNGLYMFQELNLKNVSQEFKLSNNHNKRFTWVTGLYFEKEKNDYQRMGYQFPYINPASGQYFGNFEQDIPAQLDSKTVALFGQSTFSVTDKLALTLGARYQKIDKDVELTSYIYGVGSDKSHAMQTFSKDEHSSWNSFLPKLALSYSLDDNLTSYASYSKGYLPGGFNYFPTSSTDEIKFDAQKSDNYELGLRGNFLDNKASLGASIFYMNINDIHLYDVGYGASNAYYSVVSNGGKAISKGLELDGIYQVNNAWAINGALGFTKAKYTRHTNSQFNGNKVRMTPSFTANVGLAYTHPTGIYGRLDLNSQGSIYFDDNNKNKQNAWNSADFRLGYLNNEFNIYGYVKNLTNASYIENNQSSQVYFNAPRAYGLGLKYSF